MQIAPKLSSWNLTSIVVDDHTTTYPRCAACSLFVVTAALFLVTAARTPSSHFVSLTRGCWPLGPKPQQKQEPRRRSRSASGHGRYQVRTLLHMPLVSASLLPLSLLPLSRSTGGLPSPHLPSSHLPHCWCLQSRGERRSSNRGYDDRRDRPHRPSQVHSFELLPALFLPQAAR